MQNKKRIPIKLPYRVPIWLKYKNFNTFYVIRSYYLLNFENFLMDTLIADGSRTNGGEFIAIKRDLFDKLSNEAKEVIEFILSDTERFLLELAMVRNNWHHLTPIKNIHESNGCLFSNKRVRLWLKRYLSKKYECSINHADIIAGKIIRQIRNMID